MKVTEYYVKIPEYLYLEENPLNNFEKNKNKKKITKIKIKKEEKYNLYKEYKNKNKKKEFLKSEENEANEEKEKKKMDLEKQDSFLVIEKEILNSTNKTFSFPKPFTFENLKNEKKNKFKKNFSIEKNSRKKNVKKNKSEKKYLKNKREDIISGNLKFLQEKIISLKNLNNVSNKKKNKENFFIKKKKKKKFKEKQIIKNNINILKENFNKSPELKKQAKMYYSSFKGLLI